MEERLRFIAAVLEEPKGNVARLCARSSISRTQGYKWLSRYRELGPAGLEDRRPVAKSCPHKTTDSVIDRILAIRKSHPHDGPKKIRARLLAAGGRMAVPAVSTIGEMLTRHGLIRPRRALLRVPPIADSLAHAPNEVWTTDFHGHFVLGDGTQCHPLTITATRYLVLCEGMLTPRYALVKQQFERAFNAFGLPRAIRSGNGAPFAARGL